MINDKNISSITNIMEDGNYNINRLAYGIDTLEMVFYGDIDSSIIDRLEHLKNRESNDGENTVIKLGSQNFYVLPHGAKRYKYIIKNNLLNIKLTERIKNDTYPNVYVRLSSEFLWLHSEEKAYKKLKNILNTFMEIDIEKISRVDIALDLEKVHNVFCSTKLKEYIVSKAKTRTASWEADGDAWSWYIGSKKSNHFIRIYNKTKEIKKRKKDFIKAIWNNNGYEGGNVWRIELQCRAKTLREYSINDFKDLKDILPDLWRGFFQDWFTLRKKDDSNNSRRTIFTLYKKYILSTFKCFGQLTGIIRDRSKKGKLDNLINSAVGYMTSIGALCDINSLENLLYFIIQKTKEKLKSNDEYLTEIEKKIPKYQEQYAS
ncbi:MAG: hypothetical protein ACOCRX_07600 [Candidatus Woesearchaeota archaeon]